MQCPRAVVRRRSLVPVILLLLGLLVTTAPAQTAIHRLDGDLANDHAGRTVGGGFDVDKDGVADVIVGLPDSDVAGVNGGAARVVSGATGLLIWEFSNAQLGAAFGSAVCIPGDLDGDGHAELFVGGPLYDVSGSDCGRAWVYSGLTGNALFNFSGS